MTQSITYGGVDIAGHIKLPDGITGMTSHADGTYGAGSALIDDGAGIFNLVSLQEFIHEESACSQPRTFTGFLVQRRLSRGVQVPGSGRDHDLDIVDLNYLLHLQPLRGATAKRPLESGDDRMAWLMASVALDGIVFDNGLIGSNPNMFDEADYTLQYADDVLQDLSVSSSAEVGRIFFVYRDSTTGEPSLFMDRPTVTSYTSTLSISNDLDDLSDTCFPPYMDAELTASGEDIYCSVFFKYNGGTVFRHSDTTHATYFDGKGYHRQGIFETTRVGSRDTAIRHADAWLANHSGDLDTVICQIQLPADKVNLIEAGMRVQCKFTHFPGFETFGYLRVASRTVGLEPVNDLYLVRLELSNRTITPTGTGSGSTDDFPAPPPVVSGPCGPDATYLSIESGTSTSAQTIHIESGQYVYVLRITIDITWLGTSWWHLWLPRPSDSAVSPSFTVPEILEIPSTYPGDLHSFGTWESPNMTGDSDMNVNFTYPVQEGHGVFRGIASNNFELSYFQADETGDYHMRAGNAVGDGYFANTGYTANVCIVVSDLPPESFNRPDLDATTDSEPPRQGQPTVPAPPNETPDGSTTEFTTPFPYANTTLHVTFNGQELTRDVDFTETDPATGTFTFTHAPPTGSEILVWYQGR